ncbi:hypothetical protein TRVL_09050 [Trypanosoma vivax]|nr:hypothetical protein TRVL_09050 [Trypanosoma vivax]
MVGGPCADAFSATPGSRRGPLLRRGGILPWPVWRCILPTMLADTAAIAARATKAPYGNASRTAVPRHTDDDQHSIAFAAKRLLSPKCAGACVLCNKCAQDEACWQAIVAQGSVAWREWLPGEWVWQWRRPQGRGQICAC